MIDDFLKYIESERRYSPLTVRNYRHDIEAFDAWRRERIEELQVTAATEGESCDIHPEIEYTTAEDIRNWIVYRTDK